ncbi:hypothetical protein MMC20_003560 [Loxospora ochrophaea]|nr:hypothetical protein [Loxospora ochrophaea]
MSSTGHVAEPRNFEPKDPPKLDPPKSDPFTAEELAKFDGSDPSMPVYVAVKRLIFDVSGKESYAAGGPYHVFAGKDPSRALAQTSVKKEDCVPEYEDLTDKEKKVLDDWLTYFTKRYNIVGKLVG